MKKISVVLFVAFNLIATICLAQSIDSIQMAHSFYDLGVQYKDGKGVTMDYSKAVYYFTKASNLGDPQSDYALAYMSYKGLGCNQNYNLAASLFAKGALIGKDNSMYFYGLCWRNGYGLPKSEDSAKYWLQKSADLGYRQSIIELKMNAGENSNDSAKVLLQQISNAALPKQVGLNQYQRIDNHQAAADLIAGYYKGYIIQYDWSGQNAVSSKSFSINLAGRSNNLDGYWIEQGIDSIRINASLHQDSLSFNNTKYGRKDHYSPDSSVKYDFQGAKLNLVQKDDTVFLAGNVAMFSPERKEPSKPIFIAVYRLIKIDNEAISSLKVSPNPFSSTVNVEFSLTQFSNVEVQLLSMEGSMIYRNLAGNLAAGQYRLTLQPRNIANGAYLVKIICGNKTDIKKLIKN